MKRYTKNLLNSLYNMQDTLLELLNYLKEEQEEVFLDTIRFSIRHYLDLLLELEPENECFNDIQIDINILESTYKHKEMILNFNDNEIEEMILEVYNKVNDIANHLLK